MFHHQRGCGCTDRHGQLKQQYTTRAEAQEHADHALRSREVHLRVYRCDWGGGWHLTSSVSEGW